MPASEYINECNKRYFSVTRNKNTKNEHARFKRKKF